MSQPDQLINDKKIENYKQFPLDALQLTSSNLELVSDKFRF